MARNQFTLTMRSIAKENASCNVTPECRNRVAWEIEINQPTLKARFNSCSKDVATLATLGDTVSNPETPDA